MTNKIVYGFVFFSAFMLVTSTIILLNGQYHNIFKFDFTPVKSKAAILEINNAKMLEIREEIAHEVRQELLDSLSVGGNISTSNSAADENYVNIQDVQKLKAKLEELKALNEKYVRERLEAERISADLDEEEFNIWVKKTAKLFESMDSKKAAKIMVKYSDNESREIIYRMNKKKAAEILAQLNPEDAKKITQSL